MLRHSEASGFPANRCQILHEVPLRITVSSGFQQSQPRKLWPWNQEKNLPLIYYVDFPDYIKIITRKDNWNDVFAPIFGNREAVSTKLRELEPIRNIAHSRDISIQVREKLEIYLKPISVG